MSGRKLTAWRARHVGFIFQMYNLIPVLTAFQNVELPLLLTGLSKAERRKHVETALGVVGLTERMNHYPRQLSGGQEQRVAIARAIVADPRILVLDDATSSVDASTEQEIKLALREVLAGRTTFVIAHRLSTIRRADVILLMEDGRVIERGTHTELMRAGGTYYDMVEERRPAPSVGWNMGPGAHARPVASGERPPADAVSPIYGVE